MIRMSSPYDLIGVFLFIMIGIYKITSPSNKIYIGQSIDIEKRFMQYKLLRCKGQTILYNSFLKYGVENHKFEVICLCKISELNYQERFFQDCFSAVGVNGLNCCLTSTKTEKMVHSIDTRNKMSASRKGKKVSDKTKKKISETAKGRIVSEKTRIKISESNKGQKRSEETRKKISEKSKKRVSSIETRKKIGESLKGKICSIETRKKISESNKGRTNSENTRLKISLGNKGKKLSKETLEKRQRIVLHLLTGVFFDSAKDASICFRYKQTTFRNNLCGLNKNKTNCIYV